MSSVFCQVLEFSREWGGSHSPEAPIQSEEADNRWSQQVSYLKKGCRESSLGGLRRGTGQGASIGDKGLSVDI